MKLPPALGRGATMTSRVLAALVGVAAASGCAQEIEASPALVDRPRVLAVVAEPPEVRPLESVELRAIVAAPEESQEASQVESWTFCTTARTAGSTSSVSPACRTEDGVPVATRTLLAVAQVPGDACRRFGPDPPPGDFRPQDPDVTGGFYQPVRLEAFGERWFHLLRLRCSLPHAPAAAARRYAVEYQNNENPVLADLTLGEESGLLTPLDVAPSSVSRSAGSTVDLELDFRPESAEGYLYFEPRLRRLVEAREQLAVTWYVTAGSVEPEWQSIEADSSRVRAQWVLPSAGGQHRLWVVLRDSRGGSAVARADVRVE